MYSEDSLENEEAGGRRELYRRDSRAPEQELDLDSRSWEKDVRGSHEEEESKDDRISKVSHAVTKFLMISDNF